MSTVITFNTKDVQDAIKDIPPKYLVPATVRALNKVAGNVKTAAARAIKARRGLNISVINKTMTVVRATRGNLNSRLVVTGKPISLRDYKARQTAKGVTVSVTAGTRKLIPGAFIVDKLSGNVFSRKGKKRLPIEKLVGPSIPSTFAQEEVKLAWLSVAKDSMLKRLNEEVRFELSKMQNKSSGSALR